MPAITLALFQMTLIMRLVRAEMLEVLRSDYIRFARARGLSERAIHFRHALKNTLVPVITDRRPAARFDRRFLDHHRDGVRLARHGPALPAIDSERRHSDHGRLSPAHRLRCSSSSISSSISSTWPWTRGCASICIARTAEMSEIAAQPNVRSPGRARTFIARLKDSDLARELSVVEGHGRGRRHRPSSSSWRRCSRRWIAPTDPFNPATNFLSDSLDPAELRRRRRSAISARNGRPGTRPLVGDPLWAARLARDRLLQRRCSAARSASGSGSSRDMPEAGSTRRSCGSPTCSSLFRRFSSPCCWTASRTRC